MEEWQLKFIESFCAGKELLLGFDVNDLLNFRQLVNSLNKTPEQLLESMLR